MILQPAIVQLALAVISVMAFSIAVVTDFAQAPRYRRADWAHWIDADQDCQTTRHEVLIAESRVPVTLSSDGCRVVAGSWYSYYDGEVVTNPARLDVDHLVPLSLAHRSGGFRWSPTRKRAYANDLDAPEHLVAVTARSNRQKGDRGPDAWRPPRSDAWCRYAREWRKIKIRWNLSMTESERLAVHDMLATCQG